MQKHRDITVSRLQNFLSNTGQFADVSLPALLTEAIDTDAVKLALYSVPNEARIPFSEAVKGSFEPVEVGVSIGPTWSTHWFRVSIEIPARFAGEEVELVFDPSCEALVWSSKGEPLMGITGANNGDRHVDFRLTTKASANERFELYIEAGCNGMFGAGLGGNGSINPPVLDRTYKLATAQLVIKNRLAWDIQADLDVLFGLLQELPKDSQTSSDALYTANKVINTFRYDDPDTLRPCKDILAEFFAKRLDTGYAPHVITALGNCHIDTAWLWPFDETKRKCARSWSTQCDLLERYKEYIFTASQAQQFEWTEELYPDLFTKMKKLAKEGRFVPVGGTWVEMDCNVPSGEALCRQFLYGQRYFESRFGERSRVFWLPDTFGYSAQLPQIIKAAGLDYFFTQKINAPSYLGGFRFPNSTFMWTGLDGTSVLTHFSPADTYTAQASVHDVVYSVQNNKDKAYTNQSLLAYGNGDGGGGPLIPMIERIRRMRRLQGLPAVIDHGTPNSFFDTLKKTSKDLVEWRGELYLELHRGTYTSQAHTKKYNRSSELLLRNIEILSSLAVASGVPGYKNPQKELARLWKLVLLNQFHDVLPGSSIGIVYKDALNVSSAQRRVLIIWFNSLTESPKFYKDVATSGAQLLDDVMKALMENDNAKDETAVVPVVFNPTSWERQAEVVEITRSGSDHGPFGQLSEDGRKGLILVKDFAPYKMAAQPLEALAAGFNGVKVEEKDGNYIVTNECISLSIDAHGRITSLYDLKASRESILGKANVFKLYEDVPLYWDAWDVEVYHLEKGWDAGVGDLSVTERGPLRVVLTVSHPITKDSTLNQQIIVTAGSPRVDFINHVEWKENRRLLKVEFPVNVANDFATYETQFGFIRRPTHFNTSWDLARFEVCAHKFVDYSECGYGVALLNDSKYGFSVHGSVIAMSILRAPKAPDADCDIGDHDFRYALYPHAGSFTESNVVQAGYEFNVPLITKTTSSPSTNYPSQIFQLEKGSTLVLDTIKVAEDPAGKDIVIRMYEAYGGRGTATLTSTLPVKSAHFCNVLEDFNIEVPRTKAGSFVIAYTPHKLVSMRFRF
ncbi:Glycoside hydrolase, 38 vacuolar alpha mannosidase [Thoreauomyces humboldtii]|nr:Glycoside hydrolase, 38 vacuolar alpha mannosidase [Thoreauomyces humboldtii]